MNSTPELMNAEEFRVRLGIGRSLFYEQARTGGLPVPTLRIGRRMFFSRPAFERVLAGDIDRVPGSPEADCSN